MNKRKTISTKTRFEVLKRDLFTCQYCYQKPPNVALEVDHLIPVSKGGDNTIDNLITACFNCNRGKSNVKLESVPLTVSVKTEQKKIAIDQYKQYQKILKKERDQMESDIDSIEEVYQKFKPDYYFTPKFRLSVKKFIQKLGTEEVIDSMESAIMGYRRGDILVYFCGICWTKIRENE